MSFSFFFSLNFESDYSNSFYRHRCFCLPHVHAYLLVDWKRTATINIIGLQCVGFVLTVHYYVQQTYKYVCIRIVVYKCLFFDDYWNVFLWIFIQAKYSRPFSPFLPANFTVPSFGKALRKFYVSLFCLDFKLHSVHFHYPLCTEVREYTPQTFCHLFEMHVRCRCLHPKSWQMLFGLPSWLFKMYCTVQGQEVHRKLSRFLSYLFFFSTFSNFTVFY